MSILTMPSELLASLRDYLNEPSAAFWTDAQLMRRLHAAQQDLVQVGIMASPTMFVETYDISLVADQALYDLPLNARLGTRWIGVENRVSGEPYYYVYDVDLRRYLEQEQAQWPWETDGMPKIAMQGPQVRITPTPNEAVANGIRYMYNPAYGNMLQGALTATTTTTFEFTHSTAPDYSSSWGQVDNRDDFYNGMEAFVVSGTGAGQYRKISDYTGGSSRTFTVETAFTSIATTDSVVAIMSPIPEEHREVQVLSAARTCAVKGSRVHRQIVEEYYGSPGRPGRYHAYQAWLEERQDWRPQQVEPWTHGD